MKLLMDRVNRKMEGTVKLHPGGSTARTRNQRKVCPAESCQLGVTPF